MAKKTFHGSCDCGKVRFEVKLDLNAGTFKCNCTSCTKWRFWPAIATPVDLTMISGEKDLTEFGEPQGNRNYFCKHCGIKPFGRGRTPDGQEIVGVSLASLDDLDPREWALAPVKYIDGRNDRWDREPEFVGHL
jgi:hypothetical protein